MKKNLLYKPVSLRQKIKRLNIKLSYKLTTRTKYCVEHLK